MVALVAAATSGSTPISSIKGPCTRQPCHTWICMQQTVNTALMNYPMHQGPMSRCHQGALHTCTCQPWHTFDLHAANGSQCACQCICSLNAPCHDATGCCHSIEQHFHVQQQKALCARMSQTVRYKSARQVHANKGTVMKVVSSSAALNSPAHMHMSDKCSNLSLMCKLQASHDSCATSEKCAYIPLIRGSIQIPWPEKASCTC